MSREAELGEDGLGGAAQLAVEVGRVVDAQVVWVRALHLRPRREGRKQVVGRRGSNHVVGGHVGEGRGQPTCGVLKGVGSNHVWRVET